MNIRVEHVQVPDGYLLAVAVDCFGLVAIGMLLLAQLFVSNRGR